MWRIDALSLGSRQMARYLRREVRRVGRCPVRRLVHLMGLEAIYRRPRTSVAQPGHGIYRYLLPGGRSTDRTKCGVRVLGATKRPLTGR